MYKIELQWWVNIFGLSALILAHCFLRYPFRHSRFNVDDVNALYGPYFKVSRKGLAPDLQETFIQGSYNLFIYPMVLMWLTFTLLPRRFSPSLIRHSLTLHNLVVLTIFYVWILNNFGLQWALLSTAILAVVSSQPGYGVYSLYIEFLFNLPLWVFIWLSWTAIQTASPLLLCLSGLLFSTAIMASKLMYYPLMLCPLIWCLLTGHFSFLYIPAIILGALGGPLLLFAVHPPTFQMIYRQYVRIFRDFALTVGIRRWDLSFIYLSGAMIPPSVFLWSQIGRITNPGAMVYTGTFFLMALFLYGLFSGMRTRYYYPILFPFLSLWAGGGIMLMIQSAVFNIPWFLILVATLVLLTFNIVNNIKGEYSSGKHCELVLCPFYFKDGEPEEIRNYNQYCRKAVVDDITNQVRRESSRDDFIAVLGPQSIIYLEADRRSSMRISGMCYDSYLYAWWDEDFRRSFTSRTPELLVLSAPSRRIVNIEYIEQLTGFSYRYLNVPTKTDPEYVMFKKAAPLDSIHRWPRSLFLSSHYMMPLPGESDPGDLPARFQYYSRIGRRRMALWIGSEKSDQEQNIQEIVETGTKCGINIVCLLDDGDMHKRNFHGIPLENFRCYEENVQQYGFQGILLGYDIHQEDRFYELLRYYEQDVSIHFYRFSGFYFTPQNLQQRLAILMEDFDKEAPLFIYGTGLMTEYLFKYTDLRKHVPVNALIDGQIKSQTRKFGYPVYPPSYLADKKGLTILISVFSPRSVQTIKKTITAYDHYHSFQVDSII